MVAATSTATTFHWLCRIDFVYTTTDSMRCVWWGVRSCACIRVFTCKASIDILPVSFSVQCWAIYTRTIHYIQWKCSSNILCVAFPCTQSHRCWPFSLAERLHFIADTDKYRSSRSEVCSFQANEQQQKPPTKFKTRTPAEHECKYHWHISAFFGCCYFSLFV